MGFLSELRSTLQAKRGFDLNMAIGVDGFVDEILHVVDKRLDAENFTRINTLAELGSRVSRSAGLSTNIELVTVQTKLGGNGPILSNALIEYGVNLTYFGAIGYPEIHPVFKPMADKASKVYSLSNPALTDALEFSDGKLMLGKHKAFREITWGRCKEIMGGPAAIAAMIDGCHLFGMENWTMIPFMSPIWEGLIAEVFPLLKTREKKPLAFFDLADPEKHTKGDIRHAMGLIGRFEGKFRAVLGLNEKELFQIAEVLDVKIDEHADSGEKFRKAVVDTYNALGIYCLVVHPVKEAACCIGGEYFRTDGPYCANPVLTTGAGDNFNAGFCLGISLGLDPLSALALGVSTSGFYVRNARSPSFDEVIDFISLWEAGKAD